MKRVVTICFWLFAISSCHGDDSLAHGRVNDAKTDAGTLTVGAASSDRKLTIEFFDTEKKWTKYKSYLDAVQDRIKNSWLMMTSEPDLALPIGINVVTVKFLLGAKGEVWRIILVKGENSTVKGEGVCVASVMRAAPYAVWSENMQKDLGTEQVLTCRFSYR